jgi:uncharacterized protein
LKGSLSNVKGVMLASVDGLAISHLVQTGEADQIAAMSATTLGLGKRVIEAISAGSLSEVIIAGDAGQMFIYAVRDQAVLVVITGEKPNIGMIQLQARNAAKQLASLP